MILIDSSLCLVKFQLDSCDGDEQEKQEMMKVMGLGKYFDKANSPLQ